MKANLERVRLQQLLDIGLLGGEGQYFTVKTSQKGILTSNLLYGSVGVYSLYPQSYFRAFEASNELFAISSSVRDVLKHFVANEISMETTSEKIVLRGEKENYEENLLTTAEEFPLPMTMTPRGPLPQKFEPKLVVQTQVSEFDVPDSDLISFETKDGKLIVGVTCPGTFTRVCSTRTVEKFSDGLKVTFDGNLLSKLLKLLYGEVWLNLNEQAIVLTQATSDYYHCLMLSSISV